MDTNLDALQMELSVAYTNFVRSIGTLEPDKRGLAGVSGHWSAKDVVAHLVGWDEALQTFIADPEAFDPAPLYDTNAFNAKSVSDRRYQSWEQTVGELKSGYSRLENIITTVHAEMVIYDRVCEWLQGRRTDYTFHTNQLDEWKEHHP